MIPEHLARRRAALVEQFERAVSHYGAGDPGAAFFANRIRDLDERIAHESGHETATATRPTVHGQPSFFADPSDGDLG